MEKFMENMVSFLTNILKLMEANIRFHKLSSYMSAVCIKCAILGQTLRKPIRKHG